MKKSGRGRCSYCGGKKSIRFAGWGTAKKGTVGMPYYHSGPCTRCGRK